MAEDPGDGAVGRFVCSARRLAARGQFAGHGDRVPAIVADIGGVAYVAWTITLYQIGAIVGGYGDRTAVRAPRHRARPSAAALLYGVGCVAAALAPDMAVLLAARLVQGLGGGTLLAWATSPSSNGSRSICGAACSASRR